MYMYYVYICQSMTKGDGLPKVTIWLNEDDHKEVKQSAKAHNCGLGAFFAKLVKEDKERKQREFHK